MRRALLLLSLLPSLALAQFLPRKTTINQTVNLSTDWTATSVTADVLDAGTLNITGDSVMGGFLSVNGRLEFDVADGGSIYITGPAAVDGNLQVGGTATVIGVASFGDVDAGSIYATGAISGDGNLTIAGTAEIGDIFTFGTADGGTLVLNGPAYLSSFEASSSGSVNGLFEFSEADGGTLALSGDFAMMGVAYLSGDVWMADAGVSALTVDALTVNQSMASLAVDDLVAGDVDAGTLYVSNGITSPGLLDLTGSGVQFFSGSYFGESGANIALSHFGGDVTITTTNELRMSAGSSVQYSAYPETATILRGGSSDDAGTSLVNVRITTRNDDPWTVAEQHLFETCNGGSDCSGGLVYWVNPFGDTGQTGDAGFGGSVSVAGSANLGPTSVTGYLGATGDAGVNHLVATGGIQPAQSGSSISFYLVTTHASLDLASVGDGDCSALTTETVTGAALGDACLVACGIALESGGFLTCAVTNTDEAKWQLCNNSGGAIDHAEDTFTIRVLR